MRTMQSERNKLHRVIQCFTVNVGRQHLTTMVQRFWNFLFSYQKRSLALCSYVLVIGSKKRRRRRRRTKTLKQLLSWVSSRECEVSQGVAPGVRLAQRPFKYYVIIIWAFLVPLQISDVQFRLSKLSIFVLFCFV